MHEDYPQSSWEPFVNRVKSALHLSELEGIYTDSHPNLPIYTAKSLKDKHSYVVKPTEACALVRSLTIDRLGHYPSYEIVERSPPPFPSLQVSRSVLTGAEKLTCSCSVK